MWFLRLEFAFLLLTILIYHDIMSSHMNNQYEVFSYMTDSCISFIFHVQSNYENKYLLCKLDQFLVAFKFYEYIFSFMLVKSKKWA